MSRSIYLGADGKLCIKQVTEARVPQKSQALVSVRYSGVNLCDLNFSHIGLNSYVTGFEFAGTVEATGPDSTLHVGDVVVGLSPVSFPQPSSLGTHQDKAIVESDLSFKIPAGLPLTDAAGLVLVTQTAADALFNVLGHGLPAADVAGADATGRAILIWGGASSVGVAAIQLVKAAGFGHIFATASPKNHAVLQKLGATRCFDYNSPVVAEDIRAAAEELGVVLATAFDIVGNGLAGPGVDPQRTSPALVRRSLSAGVPEESLKLACTLPVPSDPAFGFCTSYRPAGSVGAMGSPQDPEFPVRSRKVMSYLLSTLERVPRHPNVTVVKGGEAGIKEIERVAHGGASLEKVVIEHPI